MRTVAISVADVLEDGGEVHHHNVRGQAATVGFEDHLITFARVVAMSTAFVDERGASDLDRHLDLVAADPAIVEGVAHDRSDQETVVFESAAERVLQVCVIELQTTPGSVHNHGVGTAQLFEHDLAEELASFRLVHAGAQAQQERGQVVVSPVRGLSDRIEPESDCTLGFVRQLFEHCHGNLAQVGETQRRPCDEQTAFDRQTQSKITRCPEHLVGALLCTDLDGLNELIVVQHPPGLEIHVLEPVVVVGNTLTLDLLDEGVDDQVRMGRLVWRELRHDPRLWHTQQTQVVPDSAVGHGVAAEPQELVHVVGHAAFDLHHAQAVDDHLCDLVSADAVQDGRDQPGVVARTTVGVDPADQLQATIVPDHRHQLVADDEAVQQPVAQRPRRIICRRLRVHLDGLIEEVGHVHHQKLEHFRVAQDPGHSHGRGNRPSSSVVDRQDPVPDVLVGHSTFLDPGLPCFSGQGERLVASNLSSLQHLSSGRIKRVREPGKSVQYGFGATCTNLGIAPRTTNNSTKMRFCQPKY